ncbi:hypothetical protein D918_06758 [Trichuris suis]|nr:hypothetical protein D918_06758 [Trichuris suis]
MINVDRLTRMCKRFCKAVMEDSEIATKYEWSHRADNRTFFEMLRSLERLDEEEKANTVNHRITFRRYAHRSAQRRYKREIAFSATLMALYAIGAGFFIAGLWTPALGVIIGTTILALIFSFVKHLARRRP